MTGAAPVDVVAVIDADAHSASLARQWDNDAPQRALDSDAARAALVALVREVDIVADALAQDGRGAAGMTKVFASKRLRDALSAFGGAR